MTNASAEKLKAFINGGIEKESTLHTDGWSGYRGIEKSGFTHITTALQHLEKDAHVYFPAYIVCSRC